MKFMTKILCITLAVLPLEACVIKHYEYPSASAGYTDMYYTSARPSDGGFHYHNTVVSSTPVAPSTTVVRRHAVYRRAAAPTITTVTQAPAAPVSTQVMPVEATSVTATHEAPQ